ncbi:esterase [Anaplasma platys]|uniref:Esterase n=1 Tax=Anaplasma platys TaxID=949 RepID=A0A858PYY6_9RICK|nr:alpha/beta fold hydrolase [Anaplasma platys]QJC27777.1 esterase [Anaplasma platys]
MTTILNGPCYSSGSAVDSLVVLLHGRGASGDNLISIAPYMSRQGLGNTKFVAPHAPMPYGPAGYTWFTDSLRDMDEKTAFTEIMEAVQKVNRFVDSQLAMLDISDDKLAFVGFSQGAMLSMYLGLNREKECAAVVAYSGAVPFPAALEPMIRSRPPVCVVHGEDDDVIPFEYFGHTTGFLERNNVRVDAHGLKDLDHSISNEGLEIGLKFIKDRITK